MRTWASLPAELGHASSALTARYSSCTHHRSSLAAVRPSGSRAQYSTLYATSRSRAARSRERQGRRIIDSRIVRPFSNTRCAQINIAEDDEEELPRQTTHRYAATRTRPTRTPMLHGELSQLIKSRRQAPPPPPPPKPFNPAKLRAIDKMASSAFSVDARQLIGRFLQLKWAHLEDHLLQCAKINRNFQRVYDDVISAVVASIEDRVLQSRVACQHLAKEYTEVEFREIPRLIQDVTRAVRSITELRVRASTELFLRSQRATQDVQKQLYEEFLWPRETARAKIHRLLNYHTQFQATYRDLRKKHTAVRQNLKKIQQICRDLSPTIKSFQRHYDWLHLHDWEFSAVGHFHRAAWLARQKRFDPLRAAELWDITRSPAEPPFPKVDRISAILFDGPQHRDARRKLEKLSLVHASRIRTMFMSKLRPGKSASSPELNMYWRQLDIMAPLFIQFKHADILLEETRYLLGTLTGQFGGMWSNLKPGRTEYHKASLFGLGARLREHQRELLSDLIIYRSINWIRLGIEVKLDKLGLPNEIQERGLFVVPNPLSQNKARFEDWVRTIVALHVSCFIPRQAFEWSKGENSGRWEVWQNNFEQNEKRQILQRRAKAMDLGSVAAPRKGRIRVYVPPAGSAKRHRKSSSAVETSGKSQQKADSASDRVAEGDIRAKNRLRRKHFIKAKPNPPDPCRAVRKAAPGYIMPAQLPEKATEKINAEGIPPAVSSGASRCSPALRHYPPSKTGFFFRRGYSTVATVISRRTRDCSQFETTLEQPSDIHVSPTGTVDASPTNPLREYTALPNDPPSQQGSDATPPQFWSYSSQHAPNGQKPIVHYCRTLESTEEIAKLFLDSKVIGFDMEWKANASASDTIQNNLSLIQIANEERIGLFQIALFKPARTLDDFISPSLKRILESTDVTKVGVSIKADATRLRKFLGIDTRSILELSHLFKLVKYGHRAPKLVNKRMVNLSEQMVEHLGLPLEKSDDVRCGDWARPLNYRQVQYAATDPYACLCLFNAMELKRVAMDPMPPRPAHAELNLPILLPRAIVADVGEKDVFVKPADVDVNGHP